MEYQAIQRAHRIGQWRAVKAVRFITKDTIEARMLELQDKKHRLLSRCSPCGAVERQVRMPIA